MDRREFFEAINSNCKNNEEYILELLKLRGFLFEKDNSKKLSDNSHDDDVNYLKKILLDYGIGDVINNVIVIYDCDKSYKLEHMFDENIQIGMASCWMEREWDYFKYRKHGYKVPVKWLEPFIARYIKAISACGVLTVGSCDGNHPKKNRMIIMAEGQGSIPLHRVICEECLIGKYEINWQNDYTNMIFGERPKFDTYFEVNKAAEFLYENRLVLRKVKLEACGFITKSYLKKHTPEEVEKEFVNRARELLKKYL